MEVYVAQHVGYNHFSRYIANVDDLVYQFDIDEFLLPCEEAKALNNLKIGQAMLFQGNHVKLHTLKDVVDVLKLGQEYPAENQRKFVYRNNRKGDLLVHQTCGYQEIITSCSYLHIKGQYNSSLRWRRDLKSKLKNLQGYSSLERGQAC